MKNQLNTVGCHIRFWRAMRGQHGFVLMASMPKTCNCPASTVTEVMQAHQVPAVKKPTHLSILVVKPGLTVAEVLAAVYAPKGNTNEVSR